MNVHSAGLVGVSGGTAACELSLFLSVSCIHYGSQVTIIRALGSRVHALHLLASFSLQSVIAAGIG